MAFDIQVLQRIAGGVGEGGHHHMLQPSTAVTSPNYQ